MSNKSGSIEAPEVGTVGPLVQRLLSTRHEFEAIDAKGLSWVESPPGERRAAFEVNRQWYRPDPVHESSVFLYFDLAGSREAVERATGVQDAVARIVGEDGFNPAPSDRLHSTIFTDVVAPYELLSDDDVRQAVEKYEPMYRNLPPCLVFVLGPHLTPGGGVILECRIHEPGLFTVRASAKRLAERTGGEPRIPTIEYATLGYLTNGDGASLAELQHKLGDLRAALPPIMVHADQIRVVLTVNKAITPPTVDIGLTAPPTALADAALGAVTDPVERDMLHASLRYASGEG